MYRNPLVPLFVVSLLIAACAPQGPSSEAAPAAPTNVVATPGPGYVTVTWQDESDDEKGFLVYRDTVTGTAVSTVSLEPIGETPVDVETFIDRSIEPGVEYTYAVAATGAQGSSASTAAATSASVEPGIDLSVGTYNIAPVFTEAQTAYAFYAFLPPGDQPSDPVTMSIAGPAGWNGDATYEFDIPAAQFAAGWGWAATFTPAVAGAYTATATINGTTYSATANTAASSVLDVAQNTSVTSHASDAAAFEWDAVAGAESYGVTIYDAPLRVGANAFGSAFTTGTELVVDGLTLPAGEYYSGVFAFPIDRTVHRPLKPDEFHVSLAITDTFAVEDAGDGLVEIDGLWSTSLTATASTCEQVPVGTVATSDVIFETNLNEVTATNESGAISTGTRVGNIVTLTRSDVAPWGEAYEVESISEWQDDSFAGESVYTLEGGCVITWAFAGSRVE
ncbi:MAG: fibronectin type III domain-containing protein [Thioalkalivibrio sp.]|nr:fibronectin type III domain-containing protein [Thioalkalivibrio sp.]